MTVIRPHDRGTDDSPGPTVLIRGCEVRGRIVDVRLRDGRVREIAEGLRADGEVVEAAGGALLPGLHDHHLHLRALAASLASVRCGPPDVSTPGQLEAALRNAKGQWIRGIGYHESVAGDLDRWTLDRIVPDRPVRVQHRSGALWITNSAALQRVTIDDSPDVERDERGEPNGRLWRYDDRLRASFPAVETDLTATVTRLHGFGITSVTDATPDATPETSDAGPAARCDSSAHETPRALLDVTSGAASTVAGFSSSRMKVCWLGRRKLLLPDHALPDFGELREQIGARQAENLPVAVHCVTRESLLLTLAVLDELKPLPGTRIEHAAVVPRGVERELERFGVVVVTQPDFLRTRGDIYHDEVEADDVAYLYPYERLRKAGVPVVASSDAPFGDLDPWQVIRSARDRVTERGRVMNADERVTAPTALAGYLTPAHDPGGRVRRVEQGATADLALLHVPMEEALRDPDAAHVRVVFSSGHRVL